MAMDTQQKQCRWNFSMALDTWQEHCRWNLPIVVVVDAQPILKYYLRRLLRHYGAEYHDGRITYGGYSDTMVTDEHFIARIPDNLPLDIPAPLLCAGITMYSPLRYYGLDKAGLQVGVVGIGGLGHVAVKFAKAMGAKVTVISTSPCKKKKALENLGANSFFVSRYQDQLQGASGTLDGIIDTVSAKHPLFPLLRLLKCHGKLVLVGAPEKPLELPVFPLLQCNNLVLICFHKSDMGSLVLYLFLKFELRLNECREESRKRKLDWRDKGDSRDD
ncbi:hypothetical protein Gotri_007585 [Gossypium trilobum]|uniref:Alcohol dehydrogenase-like C-terminal domain-containing protein n=1 Tax=Gossypium trilobum TaxID=34281 RepID=A0A7J9EGJ4_9ROSI|nr:hypothetical protein [Gossypium trilobum]